MAIESSIAEPMHANAPIERGQWMALAAALLGWMFDGAEMGIFSMVGRPALMDLLKTTDKAVIGPWFGVVTAGFLVGAATGGVLFGWLGDRIGRVRAMTLSVLTYALFTGFCGFATNAWQVGILRFIAALGMGGEWSLGVALVMEVWPNRSRAFMAGLIGAAANVGYLLVGFIGLGLNAVLDQMTGWLLATGLPQDTVSMLVANKGWRILMILGTLPALLTFFIRLFVPESPKWELEKKKGGTSNWATRDLLGVVIGALGPILMIYLWAGDHSQPLRIVGSLAGLALAIVGYTYPLVRFLQREARSAAATGAPRDTVNSWQPTMRRMLLGACLSAVALLGTWGSTQWAPTWADDLTNGNIALHAKEYTQIWLAFGAIVGTIAAAMTGDWLGRRVAYCLWCVLSFGSVFLLYQMNTEYGPMLLASAFVAGVCTASFYGWLPLYLPEIFRTNVRATGQGFSFNFGRIIAVVGVLQTGNLTGKYDYPLACTVISAIYFVGIVIIWLAPETKGQPLPD